MKIKGKIIEAVCFAKIIEEEAIAQIQRMCDYPLSDKIRIMPDVHAGKGCTVGTTMTITDKAVPNIVGVDIGCGMFTVNIGHDEINLEKLDEAAHFIPSGFDVWEDKHTQFNLTQLICHKQLKDFGRIERSIGTLGGGNHFIEVDKAHDGTKYLVIHSGSRNLGKQVAEFYQKLAIEINQDERKMSLQDRHDEIIRTYKEQGRHQEIQEALRKLKNEMHKTEIPEDLCFLQGKYLEDYLHDIKICQDFAKLNREKIAEVLLIRTGIIGGDSFHTIHNYIDTDEMILRKGAIAAHDGERVLIPLNMRDGSILAVGKGNPEWNYSAPHGAGRIMSRKSAKEKLNITDYQKAMKGIYTTSINENTLDEAPMAYKTLDDIISIITDSVDIIEIIKPIYNFKASL